MDHNDKPLLALPCRYLIYKEDGYHTCSLLDGAVCQAINPSLTDVTMTLIVPMKMEFKGQTVEKKWDIDHTKVKDYVDPKHKFDRDKQCPAGYSWEEVCTRFGAFYEIHKETEPKAEKNYEEDEK